MMGKELAQRFLECRDKDDTGQRSKGWPHAHDIALSNFSPTYIFSQAAEMPFLFFISDHDRCLS